MFQALLQIRQDRAAGKLTAAQFFDQSIEVLHRAKEMAAEERRQTEVEARPTALTDFNLLTGAVRPLEEDIDAILRKYTDLRAQLADE